MPLGLDLASCERRLSLCLAHRAGSPRIVPSGCRCLGDASMPLLPVCARASSGSHADLAGDLQVCLSFGRLIEVLGRCLYATLAGVCSCMQCGSHADLAGDLQVCLSFGRLIVL
jgi:hypothetical protein